VRTWRQKHHHKTVGRLGNCGDAHVHVLSPPGLCHSAPRFRLSVPSPSCVYRPYPGLVYAFRRVEWGRSHQAIDATWGAVIAHLPSAAACPDNREEAIYSCRAPTHRLEVQPALQCDPADASRLADDLRPEQRAIQVAAQVRSDGRDADARFGCPPILPEGPNRGLGEAVRVAAGGWAGWHAPKDKRLAVWLRVEDARPADSEEIGEAAEGLSGLVRLARSPRPPRRGALAGVQRGLQRSKVHRAHSRAEVLPLADCQLLRTGGDVSSQSGKCRTFHQIFTSSQSTTRYHADCTNAVRVTTRPMPTAPVSIGGCYSPPAAPSIELHAGGLANSNSHGGWSVAISQMWAH